MHVRYGIAAGAAFLMWELSTPFVHLRWFLYKMKYDHTKMYFYNGLSMILAFFLARIVWGYYSSYLLVGDVLRERYVSPPSPFPVGGTVAYCTAAVVMNSLNTWWFYKMAERAAMVVFGGKATHEVGREKDD